MHKISLCLKKMLALILTKLPDFHSTGLVLNLGQKINGCLILHFTPPNIKTTTHISLINPLSWQWLDLTTSHVAGSYELALPPYLSGLQLSTLAVSTRTLSLSLVLMWIICPLQFSKVWKIMNLLIFFLPRGQVCLRIQGECRDLCAPWHKKLLGLGGELRR